MQPNENQSPVTIDRQGLILPPIQSQYRTPRTWFQIGTFTAILAIALTAAGATLNVCLAAIDTRAKVNSMDDKIKAEVYIQVNEARKELVADYKKTSEELSHIKNALDYDKLMYDSLCASEYDGVLLTYTHFKQDVKSDQIPHSLAASIYKSAVSASCLGHKHAYFSLEELDKMEGLIRKTSTSCTAATLFNLSALYCANGNSGKARILIVSAMDSLLSNSSKAGLPPPDLSEYYAQYLIISLADPSVADPKIRAESTWSSLAALERKAIVSTAKIRAVLEKPFSTSLQDSISIAYGGSANAAYEIIKVRLSIRDFRLVPVTKMMGTDKMVTMMELMEIELKEQPKDDPLKSGDMPHEMPGPKKGPMASCCQ